MPGRSTRSAAGAAALGEYRRKRDVERTGEPRPGGTGGWNGSGPRSPAVRCRGRRCTGRARAGRPDGVHRVDQRGQLRYPRYLGLRRDKDPASVTREVARP